MRYLSGAPYAPCLRWQYGGLMMTQFDRRAIDLSGITWAADNGCYTAGMHFDPIRWLAFLRRWQGQGTCLFAVAPDVPFDMAATWARSQSYLPDIRALGYPAALAIQNGVEDMRLEWNAFDAVFIAGDKAFKTSEIAYAIIQEARVRGKHAHIARRNSLKALQEAYDMGADTVDGTFLKYGPDVNWPKMQRWFRRLADYREVDMWSALPYVVQKGRA